MIAFVVAARARLRRRLADPTSEDGFTLIYTMLVTTLVTILVASALVVATASVVPGLRSATAQAAEAAAWSGIDAFRADLDRQCGTSDHLTVDTCTAVATSGSGSINTDSTTYKSTYAYNAVRGTKWFRVTATGTVANGTLTMSRTLVADIAGGAKTNVLAYTVVTGYEAQAPDVVTSQFPKRAIALDAGASSAAGVSSSSTSVAWSGAPNGGNAGSVNICNALYAGLTGRSHNPPPGATTPYVDWLETGNAGGNSYSNYQPCQVSLGHSTKLETGSAPGGTGGYVTHDALLLSNSFPGGTGPLLNAPVYTGYRYDPTTAGACDVPNQDYRSFTLACAGYGVDVGGAPASGSAYAPEYLTGLPTVPTGAPTVASGACKYVGPTRIRLNSDGTATVTSPYTTSAQSGSPSSCYPSSYPTGIYGYTTPSISSMISGGFNGIFYAINGGSKPATPSCTDTATGATMASSSGWNLTCQRLGDTAGSSNSVFYQTSGTAGTTTTNTETATASDGPYQPAVGDNPSSKSDGSWTSQWTSFSSGTSCSTATSALDLKFFNCYQSGGAYSSSAYPSLRTTVKTALSSSPTSYDTASKLQAYLTTQLSAGNSSDAANSTPTNATNASHRWQVSVVTDAAATDGCTPASNVTGTTTTTPVSAPSSDSLFSNVAGSSASTPKTTTACYTATVTAQIGQSVAGLIKSWGDGGLLGLGVVAGSTIPQFKVTFTVKTTATSTTVTPAFSAFPNTDASGKYTDVTQYSLPSSGSAPGDLYLEGTASTTAAFVADNDVVLTGAIKDSSATDAIEVVARDDVRVYHPVTCATTTGIASTTPGFCPDDITGLYDGVLSNTNYRGDKVYTNLSSSLNDVTINAAVFALGGVSATCPQPTTGADAGVCGGEFSVDNYSRGAQLGTITVLGTLAMQHHGPVGHEWEIADTSGQSARPYSGYQLDLKVNSLQAALTDSVARPAIVNVVSTSTTTSSLWHVVSVSTGGS